MCMEKMQGNGTVLQRCCARQKESSCCYLAFELTLVSNLKMQSFNSMTW